MGKTYCKALRAAGWICAAIVLGRIAVEVGFDYLARDFHRWQRMSPCEREPWTGGGCEL